MTQGAAPDDKAARRTRACRPLGRVPIARLLHAPPAARAGAVSAGGQHRRPQVSPIIPGSRSVPDLQMRMPTRPAQAQAHTPWPGAPDLGVRAPGLRCRLALLMAPPRPPTRRHGGAHKCLKTLLRHKLVHHENKQ
jgi:hypothetical protein